MDEPGSKDVGVVTMHRIMLSSARLSNAGEAYGEVKVDGKVKVEVGMAVKSQ